MEWIGSILSIYYILHNYNYYHLINLVLVSIKDRQDNYVVIYQ